MINVRFAPSPTGTLHIGGARTALFNYLFAKKNNGKFILRIDDTDTARNTTDSLDLLISDLSWLGIDWDIGPHKSNPSDFQSSHRNDIYLRYAQNLIDNNLATRLDDGSVLLSLDNDKDVILNDLIKGQVIFPKDSISKSLTIIRQNQTATYNFATVIDDHLMNITHIFRADEHLQNTPKQILIYQLFGWDIPQFGHMGLICDMSGKKLSKRTGASSLSDFKNMGVLPQALFHYLSFLGWGGSSLDNQTASKNDLINHLNLSNVKKGSSRFGLNKLLFLNQIYLKNLSRDSFKDLLKISDDLFLDNFLKVFLPRSKTVLDLTTNLNQILNPPIYDFSVLNNKLPNYSKKQILDGFTDSSDKILNSSLIRFALIGVTDGVGIDLIKSLITQDDFDLRINKLKSYFL
jgi:glutamyl/glutaminyl-tRNA synthetase